MWLDFPLFISERYADGFVVAMFTKISATTKGVLKVPAVDLLRMSRQPAASSPEFGCSDMARWRRGLQVPATPCTAATTRTRSPPRGTLFLLYSLSFVDSVQATEHGKLFGLGDL